MLQEIKDIKNKIYVFYFIFLNTLWLITSAFGMDRSIERRCYFIGQESFYEEAILKTAKPTPKTKKPALLFEYFGLPNELYTQQAAINVKQIIAEMLLNKRRRWISKTAVAHQGVHAMSYNHDGSLLTSIGNRTICSADAEGRVLATGKFSGQLVDVVQHPTESCSIVIGDHVFHKMNTRTGALVKTVNSGCVPVACVLNANKNELAVITAQGLLKIWPLVGGLPFTAQLKVDAVKDFAIHQAGDLIAVVTQSTMQLFERSTGKVRISDAPSTVNTVAFQPQGKLLITGSTDGMVRFLKPKDPNKITLDWEEKWAVKPDIYKDKGPLPSVDMICFHPRGHLFATSNFSRDTIALWDIAGNTFATIPGSYRTHDCVVFHPTCDEIAVGGQTSDLVKIWGQEKFSLEQILFRLILKQYIIKCIAARKKPGYPGSLSKTGFIDWMSEWFYLDKENLNQVWKTFAAKSQLAIIKAYVERARKVGSIEEYIVKCERDVALSKKREQEDKIQKK